MNAYEILGLSKEVSVHQIRKAFLDKAKLFHPDLGGSGRAFRILKQAYDLLQDLSKRELLGERRIFDGTDFVQSLHTYAPSAQQVLLNLLKLKEGNLYAKF